ncbi:MAG: hypothetical protein ACP5MD_10575 [Verrucomicrobiia bacterium]
MRHVGPCSGPELGSALHPIPEARGGGFLLAGAIQDVWENNDDLWLLETDSRGRAVWDRS